MSQPASPLVPVVLDLSHHNNVTAWARLKQQGIKGVILKCTQGVKYIDPTYALRLAEARKAGLLVGAYHFATSQDPKAQVDYFLAHCQLDDDLLVALDWEINPDGPDMTVAQARAYLDYLMLKTGRPKAYIVVYGGNVIKEHVTQAEDIDYFADFRLWLCEYGPEAKLPAAWNKFWLWQFSERFDRVQGVGGLVDANVFGGDDIESEWAPGCKPIAPITTGAAPAEDTKPDDAAIAPTRVPEAVPRKPWIDWSSWSFARLNETAEQGSRLAEHIKEWKQLFVRGGTAVAGGATAVTTLVDPAKGTGHAVLTMVAPATLIAIVVTVISMCGLGYLIMKRAEKFLLTAVADGRYAPRGAAPLGHG